MANATVLFDLDDTLIDVNGFAVRQLASAAAVHGYSLDPDVIRQHPGARYIPLLQQLLDVNLPDAEAMYATYVLRYRETMAAELRENVGASDLLRALGSRGVRLGLVTNKLESLAREILAVFDWDRYFSVVVGQDTCEFQKPHPGIALHALRLLDGSPELATFVGDAPVDMQCARDAGVGTIVGLLTTTPSALLTEAGATHLYSNLGDAAGVISR